eukprot:CAMPEP_0173350980 /NCGR_PEP_ID=MMETSP1144-20121109/15203_1 /TAXON_ID=483371 /ORGANISM="non described non described, Strain CCMP2298" /LENGTH=43 /DNA_ID= /DNA_START= /DNA_END= /DNA_ORIENTATION=
MAWGQASRKKPSSFLAAATALSASTSVSFAGVFFPLMLSISSL